MSSPLTARVAVLPPKAVAQSPSSRYPITNGDCWKVTLTIGPDVYRGTMYNLSTSGIGIITEVAPPVGVDATAELTNRDSLMTLCQPVRIIHTTSRAAGGYLAGCEFHAPMPYHQVRALVG